MGRGISVICGISYAPAQYHSQMFFCFCFELLRYPLPLLPPSLDLHQCVSSRQADSILPAALSFPSCCSTFDSSSYTALLLLGVLFALQYRKDAACHPTLSRISGICAGSSGRR